MTTSQPYSRLCSSEPGTMHLTREVTAMAVTDKVQVIDQREGWQILDEAAQKYLHISATEFLRRWDAGDYTGKADTTEVMRVVQLIHLAR